MKTNHEHLNQNKSKAIANTFSHKQHQLSHYGFTDNRAETVSQQKLGAIANQTTQAAIKQNPVAQLAVDSNLPKGTRVTYSGIPGTIYQETSPGFYRVQLDGSAKVWVSSSKLNPLKPHIKFDALILALQADFGTKSGKLEEIIEKANESLKKFIAVNDITSTDEGKETLKKGLELKYEEDLDDNLAVTVPDKDKIKITLSQKALASKELFSSVLMHEFIHALQNADQPNELKNGSDANDKWAHNIETVGGKDRATLLNLANNREDTFIKARDKNVTKRNDDHPGYAMNSALMEIEAHTVEITHFGTSGVDTAYQNATIEELNRYNEQAGIAWPRLEKEQQIYWSNYAKNARGNIRKAQVFAGNRVDDPKF